ncbi:MAG: hypothetical protein LWX70_00240 [Sphingobacteriia bacterium]|nr:hypothetical protein [Sphingobacteriia bacterium]
MGLFDFLRRNSNAQAKELPQTNETKEEKELPEIPKNLFIEDNEPVEVKQEVAGRTDVNGIEAIYAFLQKDYEEKGYNDAIVNPDDSHLKDNIKVIRYDLEMVVERVLNYYDNLILDIESNINARAKAGLFDLVEQLKGKKEMVIKHINKVKELKEEANDEESITNRAILSYKNGFMKGLSALTHTNLLNKNL